MGAFASEKRPPDPERNSRRTAHAGSTLDKDAQQRGADLPIKPQQSPNVVHGHVEAEEYDIESK